MISARLIAYGIAALALCGLAIGAVHVWNKAKRVDIAEAALAEATKQHAADLTEVTRRFAESEADRKTFLARLDALDQRVADLKIPEPGKLVLTKEIPGACPVVGVSPEFVGVFNSAATAGAAEAETR